MAIIKSYYSLSLRFVLILNDFRKFTKKLSPKDLSSKVTSSKNVHSNVRNLFFFFLNKMPKNKIHIKTQPFHTLIVSCKSAKNDNFSLMHI